MRGGDYRLTIRPPMRSIAAVFLAFLVTAPALAGDREAAAREFAAAFSRQTLRAFDALAASPPAGGSDWHHVAELLDRNRVVKLEILDWREDPASPSSIQVTTAGPVIRRGPHSATRELRTTWILDLAHTADRWTIRSAKRAEAVVARRVADAASDAERTAILERHADLDRSWIARELVKLTEYGEPFAGRVDIADLAIDLARGTGDARSIALTMVPRIGTVRLAQGQAAAAAYSAEVLDAARRSGAVDPLAAALFRRSTSVSDLASLREAAGLIDQIEDPRVALKAQTVLCNLLLRTDDFAGVAAEVDRLEALSRLYEWREGEFNARNFRSQILLRLGHFDLGLREMQELRDDAKAAGNELAMAIAAHNVAMITYDLGRDAQAAVHALERSMPTVDRLLLPTQRAHVRRDLAKFYARLGCHDEAERILAEALALDPSMKASLHRYLAGIRLEAGRHEGALEAARTAIDLVSADETPHHDDLLVARLVAARSLRALGRDDEAMTELEQAVALVDARAAKLPADALARASYIEGRVAPYLELIHLLVDRGLARDALLVAERMRAGALREALRSRHVDLAVMMTGEEKAREDALDARIVAINRAIGAAKDAASVSRLKGELDVARKELSAYRTELYLRHPLLGARRAGLRDEIDLAGAGTPAIEFVAGDDRTIVFAKDAGGNVTAAVIPIRRSELEERVARFERAVTSRNLGYGRDARMLYELLVRPVESKIERDRTLCIVPDGILWRVPFQALIDRDGRHLVESQPIYYATSLTLSARSRDAGPARLLAFGNPLLANETLARVRSKYRREIGSLPDAETEVRAVAALYGEGNSRVYIGSSARESAFKREAPEYSVLHIASHGMIDDSAPMFSALLLAIGDDAREDGMLEAREVLDLRLNADLAVLSACHTAGAQWGHGEGIVGLSWAFLAAGCPTTVVSHWKAESNATSKLMIAFHKALVAGRTPAAALRDAQRALMRDRRYAHPMYWATFVVLGAGQ